MYKFKSTPARECRDSYSHFSDRDLLLYIIQRIDHMSKQISELQADVANNTTVVGSAVALLGSLSQQLKVAIAAMHEGDDGEALDALSSALEANTNSLAQAVAANTPGLTGSASDSTPVHPSTDLPATPDAGSAAPVEPPAQS